jgi:4-hydroxyacetophenone monooxygenase
MYGPNTNMGHGGSVMWLAETQARYICGCLVKMAERGLAAVECREARRTAYTREIDDLHAQLVWTHPGMTTYYRNRHGKVRSPMPFRLVDYWARTREAGLGDFVCSPGPAR